jgi:hypothetical protein
MLFICSAYAISRPSMKIPTQELNNLHRYSRSDNQEIPDVSCDPEFISALTRDSHWPLCWARRILEKLLQLSTLSSSSRLINLLLTNFFLEKKCSLTCAFEMSCHLHFLSSSTRNLSTVKEDFSSQGVKNVEIHVSGLYRTANLLCQFQIGL